MRKDRIHTLTMITGVITALVVVCSQLFFFQASNPGKKDIKTEKEQNHPDDEAAYISLPSVSQQSHSTHVEVIQRSACLFEILFEKKKQINESLDVPLSLGKFFHTLFRVIISPNAP